MNNSRLGLTLQTGELEVNRAIRLKSSFCKRSQPDVMPVDFAQ
jgi:hypothetical protein